MKNKQKYFRNLVAWCIKDIDMKNFLTKGKLEENYKVLVSGEIASITLRNIGCSEIRIKIIWGNSRCTAFYAIKEKEFIEGDTLNTLFNRKWDDKLLRVDSPLGINFKLSGIFISDLFFSNLNKKSLHDQNKRSSNQI